MNRRSLLQAAVAGVVALEAAPSARAARAIGKETIERAIADARWNEFLRGELELFDGVKVGPHADAGYTQALEAIAAPLVSVSTRSTLDWRIGAPLGVDQVNAFTMGGGIIFILPGLVRLCDSEIELAAVIGHEVGHVEHRHAIRRLLAHETLDTLNLQPRVPDEVVWRQMQERRYETVARELALRSYTRLWEHEADAFAIRAVAEAGYDPARTHLFFEKLLAASSGSKDINNCLISTHPLTTERIARMKGLARRYGRRRSKPDSDAFRYLKSRS